MPENIQHTPNQWIQGEAEAQSAIMLSQHTTYFLKYKIIQNPDGTQEMQNQEILDFIEPYNPDYPLAYLKGGQKVLAAHTRAQRLAYFTAKKILSNLTKQQEQNVKKAQGLEKYNLIAKYLTNDSAANLKFCVDYFNDFSIRKQSLISGSRTTGQNPQQMRMFRNPIEYPNQQQEEPKKWKLF